MTNFKIHDINNAPEDSKPSLEAVKKAFGFVPNLIGTLAASPTATKAYLTVADLFGNSSLNAVEQQVVLLATSVENSCEYCVAAHSLMAKNFAKADVQIVEALRNNEALPDAKLNALANFTKQVVVKKGFVSKEELSSFINSGYSQENALEVIVGIAQKILSNYTNHLTDITLDDQFASEKWIAS